VKTEPARGTYQRGFSVCQLGRILTEREIRLYPRFVGPIDTRHFSKLTFALGAFPGEQVPTGRLRTQDLTATGDLEPLGNGFAGLAASNWLGHESRKIIAAAAATNYLLIAFAAAKKPNPKHQIPTIQAPNLKFGVYRLPWDLELGTWSFAAKLPYGKSA
jgi:hypothetical protein